MKDLRGRTAILTGANGGLGTHLADSLAREGVNLLLVAYPGVGLEDVHRSIQAYGIKSQVLVADLREPRELPRIVDTALASFGDVDLLVNNAGVEYTCPYDELAPERIREVLAVNLDAPMMLTRLVLPHFLRKKSGHIVSLSSLAGKSGPACQEPYAATKAALVGFTLSLRSTYRGSGVSASVVTPGFIEAGIYARIKSQSGCTAPPLLGACSPQKVCRAVLKAIRSDASEVIVNRYPVRPLLALSMASPRLGEWITARLGVHDFFRRVFSAQQRRAGK
jgi:short-subunit dehydrogenase